MIIKEKENFDMVKEFLKGAEGESDLIEVLHKVQDEFGYIPKPVVTEIAKALNMQIAAIYGVITFYSRFTLIPKGKYSISVCMGTACYVKGAHEIFQTFSKELGIGVGETTDDQLFSMVETRCVGQCDLAPVVNINEDVHAFFKIEDVKPLIEKLKVGEQSEE